MFCNKENNCITLLIAKALCHQDENNGGRGMGGKKSS